jgi:mannosyl-oligosaccharide alpha-1,2-mannosidase
MLVMGLDAEFNDAMDWVEKSLKLDNDWDASTFETTIRYLGGLLAAYELSGKEILLTKAKALADRLIPAFNTKTGIPYATVNLKTYEKSTSSFPSLAPF